MPAADDLALYIHWPFCLKKCPYCDFNSHVRDDVDADAWQAALLADLAHEHALTEGRRVGAIFFGGGTPSLMPPALAGALIEQAQRLWGLAPDAEITREANPTSFEAGKFTDFRAAGVNRVSLGVQSLHDDALAFLGREHSAAEAMAAALEQTGKDPELARLLRHAIVIDDSFARIALEYSVDPLVLSAHRQRLIDVLTVGHQELKK